MLACVTFGFVLPGVQVESGNTPLIWHFAFGSDDITGDTVICAAREGESVGAGGGFKGLEDLTTLYPIRRIISMPRLIPIIVLFPDFFLFVFMSSYARKIPIYISSYT